MVVYLSFVAVRGRGRGRDVVSTPLEEARALALQNLAVMPLHRRVQPGVCSCKSGAECGTPGKHPRIRWKDRPASPPTLEELELWFGRWRDSRLGVLLGDDLCALDVDEHGALRARVARSRQAARRPDGGGDRGAAGRIPHCVRHPVSNATNRCRPCSPRLRSTVAQRCALRPPARGSPVGRQIADFEAASARNGAEPGPTPDDDCGGA